MDKKKYKLTNDSKKVDGRILYRIRALRNFGSVKKGDFGGYIASEENLSHDGLSWISDEACAYDNARVYENAQICGHAEVFGNAEVYSNVRVSGEAHIYDWAEIFGKAWIYGNAQVYGHALVCDNVEVYGKARIYDVACVVDNARIYDESIVHYASLIYDNARIHGCAEVYNARIGTNGNIECTKQYMTFGSFGSRGDTTTIYRTAEGVRVKCGCFNGTLDEFRKIVKATHSNNQYAKEYLAIADIAEIRFGKKEEE